MPEITLTAESTRVTRTWTVRGADPLPVPYSSTGKVFAPDNVFAGWTDGTFTYAEVTGVVLLKGGTLSRNRSGQRYWAEDEDRIDGAPPQWLRELIAEYGKPEVFRV